jgi:cytochrome c peroxidase
MDQARAVFAPLPAVAENPADPILSQRVALGKMLYYDPRLSKSSTLSCNSCHNLATYGVDLGPTSLGHRWSVGPRNAPTTLNAAFHDTQFWDGRAKDVEEQAKGPVLNPGEMAMPHDRFAVERIASIPEYCERFGRAFPGEQDPVTYDNVAKAIGAFERTLVTPSRFDAFLGGDPSALSAAEKVGLQTFLDVGCAACHQGVVAGGGMFQKFGLEKPYAPLTGSKVVDEGRFAVTKAEEDRQVFKVSALRNVTQTAPYFHDGSVWDLRHATVIMADCQLGQVLTEDQARSIVVFMGSLTGEIPVEARTLPVLPASTAATPRPDFN